MSGDQLEEMARNRQILAKALRYCRHRSGSVRKLHRAYICTGCAFDAMEQARREGAAAERARAEMIVLQQEQAIATLAGGRCYEAIGRVLHEILRRLKASE